MNVFDWDKCRAWVADRQPVKVSAGILDDWFWTAATIYEDGKWLEDHDAWTDSGWGTPGFKAEMPNGDSIEVDCSRESNDNDEKRMAERREKSRKDMKDFIAAAGKSWGAA